VAISVRKHVINALLKEITFVSKIATEILSAVINAHIHAQKIVPHVKKMTV